MHRLRRLLVVMAATLLLVAQVVPAAANPQGAGNAPEFGRYLIALKPGVSAAHVAGPDLEFLFSLTGMNVMAARLTPGGLARLANDPRVEYVEEDILRELYDHDNPSPSGEITWGLDDVHAPEAWETTRGGGIKVCVIDSGIDFNHHEFGANIKDSKNFVDDGQPTAQDGLGHGTHVTGTIAAALNGVGVAGVAYGVDLYIARVFDNNGGGAYTSVIVNAVNWCSDTVGADVFNMSFGSSTSNRTEKQSMDKAYNNGRLLIAASGNSGANRVGYPAAYGSVVATGAVDRRNVLASFSQYGKDQELVAPGVGVLSTVPLGTGLLGTMSEDGTTYEAYAMDGSGTGDVLNVPLVECGLATSTSSCSGKPSSGPWIAMINRGDIAFSEKVTNVMAQGATAAIIANNDTAFADDPGSFTLGDGSFIPSVSVSYNSGVAIRNGGLGTGSVTVGVADYDYYDGTSMASPHAVGVAALAWSANRSLSNAQVRTILQETAKDLGAAGRDNTYGYGLVQAHAAVAAALAAGGGGGDPPPPGENGQMTVTIDAGGPYNAGDWVNFTITVTDTTSGAPHSGAAISGSILAPNGSTAATFSGTTNGNGTVAFRWKSNRNGAKGTYTINANATLSGYDPANGSTTFELQ